MAVADLKAATAKYSFSELAVKSAEDTYNSTKQRDENGLVSTIDFQNAQNDLNRAQINLVHARYDLIFRSKVVDFYLGQPIAFESYLQPARLK